jgi:hypothetical protein
MWRSAAWPRPATRAPRTWRTACPWGGAPSPPRKQAPNNRFGQAAGDAGPAARRRAAGPPADGHWEHPVQGTSKVAIGGGAILTPPVYFIRDSACKPNGGEGAGGQENDGTALGHPRSTRPPRARARTAGACLSPTVWPARGAVSTTPSAFPAHLACPLPPCVVLLVLCCLTLLPCAQAWALPQPQAGDPRIANPS